MSYLEVYFLIYGLNRIFLSLKLLLISKWINMTKEYIPSLWLRIWSVLINIPPAFENNVYFAVVGGHSVLYMPSRLSFKILFQSLHIYIFFHGCCSVTEYIKTWECRFVFSHFSSVHLSFYIWGYIVKSLKY